MPGSPNPFGVPGAAPATTEKPQTGFVATAYSPPFGRGSINGTGITAGGTDLRKPGAHYVIAAGVGSGLKLGDSVLIQPNPYGDNGIRFKVDDHGGAIVGKHIDIFVPTHAMAVAWGRRNVKVTKTSMVPGAPNDSGLFGIDVPDPLAPIKAVDKFLSKLSIIFQAGFWLRAGLILAGVALLAFGVVTIGRQYAVSSTLGNVFKGGTKR